jgi:tetratricopeptide (TPR) repeat protein
MKTDSERQIKEPEKDDFRTPPVDRTLPDFGIKEKAYLDILKENPDNAEASAQLGDLYFENKRFQKAIPRYEKAISLNPKDVDSHNDLGLARYYSGQTDKAIEILKRGTEVGPSYQRIWLTYGFIMTNAGNLPEAEKALKKAIEIDPKSGIGAEAQRILGVLNQPR